MLVGRCNLEVISDKGCNKSESSLPDYFIDWRWVPKRDEDISSNETGQIVGKELVGRKKSSMVEELYLKFDDSSIIFA